MVNRLLKFFSIVWISLASVNLVHAARLMDFIENASISGFAFGRYINVHGRDADGSRWQLRIKPIITTGEVAGFSATGSLFFSKGSTTPDGNNTHNDISGSRADVVSAFVDRFNIADFYVTYNAADSLHTKSILQGGQKSVNTPFNDTILDRAIGIFFENKDLDSINISLQWWDSWMGDDIFISRATPTAGQSVGLGNNAFIVGLNSSKEFSKDTGVSYNLWYAGIHRYLNYMIFADLGYSYSFNAHSISILAQSAASGLVDKPMLMSSITNYSTLYSPAYNYAKNRGMYNVRLDYKYNNEDSKITAAFGVGAAGSFGDGYGAMIDNTGAMKLGGILWNNFAGTEANGFGLIGAGGFNDSRIFLSYAKGEFNYKNFGVSLDVVYVDTTHFFVLKKGSSGHFASFNNLNSATGNIHGSDNKFVPVKFVEISPAVSYKFTSNISAILQYGYLLGDLNMGRIRFQVNYVF